MKNHGLPIALAALTLIVGADAAAKVRNFPTGSLVIAMDNCWQPGKSTPPAAPCENPEWSGGYTAPSSTATYSSKTWNTAISAPPNSATMTYGVMWFLMRHGITVNWIVKAGKTAVDDVDFQITNGSGLPAKQLNRTTWDYDLNPLDPATSGTMSFKGGPFVIHQREAAKALQVIRQLHDVPPVGAGNYQAAYDKVRVVRSEVAFDADVAWLMNEPLRSIAVNGYNTDVAKMVAYLDQSGLAFTSATLKDLDSDNCCQIRNLASCASATCTLGAAQGEYLATGTVKPKAFMLTGGFTASGPGAVFDLVGETDLTAYNDKLLSLYKAADDTRPYYMEAWFPHWDGPTGMTGPDPTGKVVYDEIVAYNHASGAIISECKGVPSFEDPNDRNVTYGKLITSFMSQKGLQKNPGIAQPTGTSASCTGCCDSISGCGGNVCSTPCTIRTQYNPTQYKNLLMQVGDYYFVGTGGNTKSWSPYVVSTAAGVPTATATNRYGAARPAVYSYDPAAGGYREGVSRLIFGCRSAAGDGLAACTGKPTDEVDWFTIFQDPNNSAYGTVVYLEGDTYDGRTDGIRLVMGTLFGLGYRVKESEVARTPPVLYGGKVYQATFRQTNILNSVLVTDVFATVADQFSWVFPANPGEFREYNEAALTTARQGFELSANWKAVLPSWDQRKVFTHFYCPKTDASCPTNVSAPETRNQPGPYTTELLFDVKNKATIPPGQLKKMVDTVNAVHAKALIEEVLRARGGCKWDVTTCTLPAVCTADGACNAALPTHNIKPRLGGVDRSKPVLVGPSKYAGTRVSGVGTRPTVAYFGALDGQVHAIYVSGGGTHAGFTPPAAGTELWSFIPPNELLKVKNNTAKVDAELAVSDVFEDFTGDGVREWRTILVGAEGGGGNHIFALDVTDPSAWNTVDVLWDKGDPAHPTYNPVALTDVQHSDSAKQTTDVTKPNGTHFMQESFGVAIGQMRRGLKPIWVVFATSRNGTFVDDDEDGVKGGSEAAVIGSDGAPGSGSSNGFLTVGLDVRTGLPIDNFGDRWWHFFRYYNTNVNPLAATSNGVARSAGNDIPAPPALGDRDQDGLVDTLLVPDLDGRVWEVGLNGDTMASKWYRRNASGAALYPVPLFDVDVSGQPVGVPVATFRQSSSCSGTTARGHFAMVVATGGTDWAGSPSILAVVDGDRTRPESGAADIDGDSVPDVADKGAGRIWKLDPAAYVSDPLTYTEEVSKGYYQTVGAAGERIFGGPVVANGDIYVTASNGDVVSAKAADVTVGESGEVYRANVCESPATATAMGIDVGKTAAQVACGTGGVFVASTAGLTRIAPASPSATSNAPGKTAGAFARFASWLEAWLH